MQAFEPNMKWAPRRTWRTVGTVCLLGLVACLGLAQGKLTFEPLSGPVGTLVTASATGLQPGTAVALTWVSADAGWKVADGKFYGIEAADTRTVLGSAQADADGNAQLTFTVPEDYGYVHNVFLVSDGADVARQGFVVVPALTISPSSGPVGTPITVTVTGVGYRFWESVWHLLYDGAHTGWLSAVTTRGTATAVIPASGAVGLHTLQILSGTHPVPYLNQQQAPIFNPQVPTVVATTFEITEGAAVAPPAAEAQVLPRHPGAPAGPSTAPSLVGDFASGTVGSPLALRGAGFPADAEVTLTWTTVRGNRLSGRGYEESASTLATLRSDPTGAFHQTLKTPDDLGGEHRVLATAGDAQATFLYTITPSVSLAPAGPVAPAGDVTITLKGVGWTETANIYTLTLDNGFIGYGCGFNSQGDVTIHLKAPGQPGMHYLSLYPAIYQGQLAGPGAPPDTATANATYLQLPMLNWRDHPGEELPAFQLAFEVR